jgi:hypothetical protein
MKFLKRLFRRKRRLVDLNPKQRLFALCVRRVS